jgi:hypothetical protein
MHVKEISIDTLLNIKTNLKDVDAKLQTLESI